MDSSNLGGNKQSSDKAQFTSNREVFQRDLTDKKPTKKVHFQCSTPIIKRQAFESTQLNQAETNQRQRYDLEDLDCISSTDTFTSQGPTIPDQSLCSARATAMTFIIIVLIILIVATAVGVTFSTIKTGQRNSTTNTNQSSVSISTVLPTASTTVLTSSVSVGNQSGAPCSSYTTINDPSRNILQTGSYRSCDNGPLFNLSTNGAWIRFIGSGGSIMASSSPGINRCGGYVTGWFNGTLPATQGTMANGSIRFSVELANTLIWYDSSVVYCVGGYYIYFLLPVPLCNARYCTM